MRRILAIAATIAAATSINAADDEATPPPAAKHKQVNNQQNPVSKKFYDQVRARVQAVRNNSQISAENKGEEAMIAALSVSLDDAILYLSKRSGGKIMRMHSNPRYSGEVRNKKDIELYKRLFAAIDGEDNKEATIEAQNSQSEMFKWDITEVDDNSIVVCRHD
ncbi:MAG: hypothetical protein V4482_06315 [Pseudomonadota bacterium]